MKYYVSMTDTFFTGLARGFSNPEYAGKIAKLIIVCDSMDEARIVAQNAEDRTDQKNILIKSKKPYYPPRTHHLTFHDKRSYPTWFREDRPFRD